VTAEDRNSEGAAIQLLNQAARGYIVSAALNVALELDLEMLLVPGGRERPAEEFASLFESAGFELARIVSTESPLCVIEARIAQRR
jgi:hypothetical protein